MPTPRIIPVLDVMGGQVVRAVGGRRSEYRPVVSRLTDSTDPVTVAEAMVRATGASELYLADLDTITGAGPATDWGYLAERLGVELWVDYGLRGVRWPVGAGVHPSVRPVVGTETASGTFTLAATEARHQRFGKNRLVVSLDLMTGVFLGLHAKWKMQSATDWDGFVGTVRAWTRTLIVLDLARVGGGQGVGTDELCRRLKRAEGDPEIVAGGGIRTRDDITRLGGAGADAVLVASALHDGTL